MNSQNILYIAWIRVNEQALFVDCNLKTLASLQASFRVFNCGI